MKSRCGQGTVWSACFANSGRLLLFTDAVEQLVKSIGHDDMHAHEVDDGSEAAHWEVALSSTLNEAMSAVRSTSH